MLGFHSVAVTITWAVDKYTDYPNQCVLLFGILHYNNILFMSSISLKKIQYIKNFEW
jgi:hypothetical protein